VLAETGLHCSIGIGDNKLRAKTATQFAKPAGTYRLTGANWLDVMGDRRTEALWGVGTKTSRKLADLGIMTVRQLATADVERMRARFGPTMGPWFILLGRGIGDTHVSAEPWIRKGLSHQTTYREDLTDRAMIEAELTALAEQVTTDVVAQGRWIERVGIVVRFPSFYTPTRITKLPLPTQDPAVVATAAVGLLDRLDLRRPVRLLGVRAELTASPA
jgi:DNA polymerase-4